MGLGQLLWHTRTEKLCFSFSQVTFINNDFSLKSITNYVRSFLASWYMKITHVEVCVNVIYIYMWCPCNVGKKNYWASKQIHYRLPSETGMILVEHSHMFTPSKIIKRGVSLQCVIEKLIPTLHGHCFLLCPNPMDWPARKISNK